MGAQDLAQWRLTLGIVNVFAVIVAVGVAIWFGVAAANGSAPHMVIASATFAAVASAWTAAFVGISKKLKDEPVAATD